MILFGLAWFTLGLKTNLLTAVMSILAIELTRMVLDSKPEREADDRRRDDDARQALRAAAHDEWGPRRDGRDRYLDGEDIVESREAAQHKVEALDEALANRGEAGDASSDKQPALESRSAA
ncbi:MAG: hypothetical protein NVS3B5_19660 [Sphingomicrobium sp.]